MRRAFNADVTWLALGAAFTLATSAAVLAADLPAGPYYTAPEPLSAFSWAGPYLGATLGYEWGGVDNSPTHPAGIAGGVEVATIGSAARSSSVARPISSCPAPTTPSLRSSSPIPGSVRSAAAPASPSITSWSTAPPAPAFGELRADGFNLTEDHTNVGWVAGAGVEVALNQRWSAKAEWLYLDLADSTFSVTATNNGLAADLLRMGVTYHF